MIVVINNLYTDSKKTLEGEPATVEKELLRLFPWLNAADPAERGSVEDMVRRVNRKQMLSAYVADGERELTKSEPRNLTGDDQSVIMAMLGHNRRYLRALDAARFLAGAPPAGPETTRQALWEADGDVEEAALLSYGLEVSEANRKALRAVQDVSKMKKATPAPLAAEISAAEPEGEDTAEAVRRAAADKFLLPVQLGGKHSQGSMLARDQNTGETWLLKPGANGPGPAAGVREEPASQSRREAAFYHVAEAWGLGDYVPRADLIYFHPPAEPVTEVAAIRLLGWDYRTLDDVMEDAPDAGRNLLSSYLSDGTIHRWAVLDYVLGNPDRHANNLMVHDGDVKLIDHGSAMAGPDFDPAHDQKSFVPYYLRAWAPGRWSRMPEADRLKYMPRLPEEKEQELRSWLEGLRPEDLDKILLRYGVRSEPAKARLSRLKMLADSCPTDLAINRAWIET